MRTFFLIMVLYVSNMHANELFPTNEERTFVTDRPDQTESPYTLSRGRLQLETDALSVSENWYKGTRTTVTTVNNLALKYGLTKDSDLMLILPSYVKTSIRTKGRTSETSGYGDSVIRHRINFQGNDTDETAYGLISFLKLPTAGAGTGNRRTEGGLIFPVAYKIMDIVELAIHLQVDHMRRDDDIGNQTDFSSAVSLTGPLAGKFSGFIELYGKASDNRKDPAEASFDFGFLYLVSDSLMIDAGTYVGLTDASDDYTTFFGITKRF